MNEALPPKQRQQRRQIAAFIALAVLMAAALVGAIAYRRGSFSEHAQAYFIADDVNGLAPGIQVRLSGLRVGQVTALELQKDLTVKVTLSLGNQPFSYLHKDAQAELVREQLKPAAIELHAGQAAEPLPADDPRLSFRRRGTLTEIAEDLRARLAPILTNLQGLTGVANAHRDDIAATLANTRALTQELAATASELHGLSTELHGRVDRIARQTEGVMGQTRQSVARLGGVIGRAEQSLDSVNARLPAILAKTDALVGKLGAVADDGKTVSAAAAANLPRVLQAAPPLVDSSRAIVDDSRAMVQGVRQSWPLRSLLPPPPAPLLPIESYDAATLARPGTPP
ncbi:MAG: MCE family protein [Burkholderiales bacterium]|nr:MCE family protein [Burkholderiales bacterium]MDE2455294.1 MCE family protein [Burkholderiales bacterium]